MSAFSHLPNEFFVTDSVVYQLDPDSLSRQWKGFGLSRMRGITMEYLSAQGLEKRRK